METTTNINENTVNSKEITVMEQNKLNNEATTNTATESTVSTQSTDILEKGVFVKLEAGQQINHMTQEAYIGKVLAALDGKPQVWAYADERVVAVTTDSSKVPAFTSKLKKIWSNVTCERVSGEKEIKNLLKRLSDIRKKVCIMDAKWEIEELGGRFENGGCTLATSDDYRLILSMFIDKETGNRYYQIAEEKEGRKWGNMSNESRFRPKDMENVTKITGYLREKLGDYSDCETAIVKICSLIDKHRLIAVNEDNIINGEVMEVEDVLHGFEYFIRNNITAEGVIAVKLRTREIHVGIGASESQTASKIFDSILERIAPANSSRATKSEMKKAGLLITDRADYQKTLAEIRNTYSDKIYSFNFDDSVKEELYELYLESMRKKESVADGKDE